MSSAEEGRTGSGSRRTISARGATSVGVASLVAAASGYVVLLVAARVLTPERNADFLVFWSLLFGLYGVLGGVQSETTRAVGADAAIAGRTRVLPWGLAVGCAMSVVLAASSSLWAERLLGPGWAVPMWALCGGVIVFTGHASTVGALAGGRRWMPYSILVGTEAASRLVLICAVALAAGTIVGLEVAIAAASAVWIVLAAFNGSVRRAVQERVALSPKTFLGNTSHALVAAASSAALVVGFPVLLRLTSTDSEFRVAAPLILAISVTRAPLLMPLAAYQGVAIGHFIANRDLGLRGLRTIVAAIVATGVCASALAGFFGSQVLQALFGPAYSVSGTVMAGLTLGATALAVITITGAAALAVGAHTLYALGWLIATSAALGLLFLPASLEGRAVTGLIVGPLVGLVIHGVAINRRARPTA